VTEDRKSKIRTHNDLEVFRPAMETAMTLFHLSKSFPKEERYTLTDQMRKSARSVCANLAEAWRKRRFEAHFLSKLSDAEAEAAETQVWIEFAVKSGYLERDSAAGL
jgi:four helix bundle protein